MVDFLFSHKCFALLAIGINFLQAGLLLKKIQIRINRFIREAEGGRNEGKSFYIRCKSIVRQSLEEYEKKGGKSGIYVKARDKMKKAGYENEFAAVLYLSLKYGVSLLLFLISFILNFPSVIEAFVSAAIAILAVETVVGAAKRNLNLRFQKYVYKIYKYLHNQVSSGVKVTDAIKTVYEVIDDRQLKELLVKLAARYDLTLDIDMSLEEFKASFDIQEAETLCIALKQGIMTGDNQELLARQEEVMFKKYFNFIQAETDSCKNRSLMAAALFTAIIVIMIAVPMFRDVTEAMGKIFVN